MPLGVGIIGVGGMGHLHAATVATATVGATLVGVYDPDADNAGRVTNTFGGHRFLSPAELIESPTVGAVIVASPDSTHAELALRCLEVGKPVLVEKPLAISIEEALAVVKAERQLDRRLVQVGFMRRYDPAHTALAQAVAQGAVGRPLLFRGWHRNPSADSATSSLDLLVQSAVHDFYSARWLLDQEAVDISVTGTAAHPGSPFSGDPDSLDVQLITIRFDGGGVAVVEVNRHFGDGYEVGVEIIGDNGTIATGPGQGPIVRAEGHVGQRLEADWLVRFADAYRLELQAWVASILGNGEPGPSAYDGYVTLAMAHAAYASIAANGPVPVVIETAG